jgi:site-specific recombinase XerD
MTFDMHDDDDRRSNSGDEGSGSAREGADVPRDDDPLPNARDVNRQLRAQRRAERQQERAKGRGVRQFEELMREVCRRKPNNIFGQIELFLERTGKKIPAGIGRKRFISEATLTVFGSTLLAVAEELRANRVGIRNLNELGRKHVVSLVSSWVKAGQAASTIQKKTSAIRRFLELTGRPGTVPTGAEWIRILNGHSIDTACLRRVQVAQTDKSWESHGIDPLTMIDEIALFDPVVAAHLLLEYAFGTRVLEAMRLTPHIADGGTRGLHLTDGTKGGRHRWVELDTDPEVAAFQREVVRHISAIAAKHPKALLAHPGLRLTQMKRRYYYVCTKFGITQAELGITSHGLRHSYMHRLFESVSGLPAPVRHAAPVQHYHAAAEKIKKAELASSRNGGHARRSISRAYNASVESMTVKATNQLLTISAKFQTKVVQDALRAAGHITTWLIGRAGNGMPLASDEPVEVHVLRQAGAGDAAAATLGAELTRLVGRAVLVTFTENRNERPEFGFELMFDSDREPARADGHFRKPGPVRPTDQGRREARLGRASPHAPHNGA